MTASVNVGPSDISLFHVAADKLGDATQWNRIADLNGLDDPQITSIMTLALPPVDPTQTGGIPLA